MKKYRNRSYPLLSAGAITAGALLTGLDIASSASIPGGELATRLTVYAALTIFGILGTRVSVQSRQNDLTVRNLFKAYTVPWNEIEGFRVEQSLIVDLKEGRQIKCIAVQPGNLSHATGRRTYAHRVAKELNSRRG